ncbi:MAG: AI-2E family transporter [Verrucomicrobiota bacterium]|nr:AI-2E family transporter [Verrucomicrobiota bacterium]
MTNEPIKKERVTPALSYGQFVKRVLTVTGVVTAIAVLWLLIWFSIHVWLIVFAGILLAIFLRGLANLISTRTPLSPISSLVLVVVSLLALCALAGWLVAPHAEEQFNELANELPRALGQFREQLQGMEWARYLEKKLPVLSDFGLDGEKIMTKVGGFFSVGLEAVTSLGLVLFLGLYLAAEPQVYVGGLLHLFPIHKRARVREILDEIGTTLRNWLLGQLFSMIVVGTLTGIGLMLIGIPLPIALGVLAGLFNFVPMVGALVSAIPAILLAFLISPWHAFYVVLLYLVVNCVIESNVIAPLVQRYTVLLPPALTVLALVLLGVLCGFLGVLLAIPLTATAFVLVKMAYVYDMLGDTTVGKNGRKKHL